MTVGELKKKLNSLRNCDHLEVYFAEHDQSEYGTGGLVRTCQVMDTTTKEAKEYYRYEPIYKIDAKKYLVLRN